MVLKSIQPVSNRVNVYIIKLKSTFKCKWSQRKILNSLTNFQKDRRKKIEFSNIGRRALCQLGKHSNFQSSRNRGHIWLCGPMKAENMLGDIAWKSRVINCPGLPVTGGFPRVQDLQCWNKSSFRQIVMVGQPTKKKSVFTWIWKKIL